MARLSSSTAPSRAAVTHVPDASPQPRSVPVGAVNDPAEADADRLAARALGVASSYETVRRSGDGTLAGGFDLDEGALRAASTGPRPLDGPTRDRMEGAFGRDLGDVRVHDGAAAADLASDIGTRAFTHGQDVYFGAREYQPGSPDGGHVLAHELAHTVQAADAVHRYPASWAQAPVDWGAQTANVVRPGGGVSGGVYIMQSHPNNGPVRTAVAKPTFGKNAANEEESGEQIVAADRLMREFGLAAPTSRIVKKGSVEFGNLLALCQPRQPLQPANGQPGRDSWKPLADAQDFVVMSEIVNARTMAEISTEAGTGGNAAKSDLLLVLRDQQLMHDLGKLMVADMVTGNSDRFLGMAKNLGNVMVSVLNGQRTLNVFDTTAFLPKLSNAADFLGTAKIGGVNLGYSTQNPDVLFDEVMERIVKNVKAGEPQGGNGPTFGERLETWVTQSRPTLFGWFMAGWQAGMVKAQELSQGDNASNVLGDLAGEKNVSAEQLKAASTFVANSNDPNKKLGGQKAAALIAKRTVDEIDLQQMSPDGGIVDPANWVHVPSKVAGADWVANPRMPTPQQVRTIQPARNEYVDAGAYRTMKADLLGARDNTQQVLGNKVRKDQSQPRDRTELGRAVIGAEALALGVFWMTSCATKVMRASGQLAALAPAIGQLTRDDAAAIAAKTRTVQQYTEMIAGTQAKYAGPVADALKTAPKLKKYGDRKELRTTMGNAQFEGTEVVRKVEDARKKKLQDVDAKFRVQVHNGIGV